MAGALLGALATALRTGLLGGGGLGGETYLLDAAAVAVCAAGVAIEGRAAMILADGMPGLRRRAILHLLAGGVVALTGCLVLPALTSGELAAWQATVLAGLVYLGASRGLSGAAGVAITTAPGYLAGRIDERIDEPW